MMDLSFNLGQIITVTPTATDAGGKYTPSIGVKSFLDGSILTLPLATSAYEQNMPIPGWVCLYVRFGKYQGRVVKIWGGDEDFIRKGQFALNPGEVFVQSATGYGYLKLDQDGRVQLVGGDMISILEHGDDGTTIRSPQIFLHTTVGSILEMDSAGVIRIERLDKEGNTKSSFTLDAKDNILMAADGDVSIKAKNIYLDGQIFSGPGATDPTKRTLFAPIVTSGPTGTYPTDFMTGAPIPGNTSVKAGA